MVVRISTASSMTGQVLMLHQLEAEEHGLSRPVAGRSRQWVSAVGVRARYRCAVSEGTEHECSGAC